MHATLSIKIHTSLSHQEREEKAEESREMEEGQSTTNNKWNPTTEQIALLEATYSQGMRTPNPDQIEQIASRLRLYGNIEGKSVFYWFQNRKTRERQRQKQERVASNNQFLQPPSMAGTSHTNSKKLCATSFNLRNKITNILFHYN